MLLGSAGSRSPCSGLASCARSGCCCCRCCSSPGAPSAVAAGAAAVTGTVAAGGAAHSWVVGSTQLQGPSQVVRDDQQQVPLLDVFSCKGAPDTIDCVHRNVDLRVGTGGGTQEVRG
jgi:hypothetical protein